ADLRSGTFRDAPSHDLGGRLQAHPPRWPYDHVIGHMPRIMGIVNLTHPLDLVAHGIDGRILEVLCGAEAAFTGRQVHALLSGGSAAGVQLGLNRLRRQGIVTAEPAGRAILYRLNASHLAAPYLRAPIDLR